MPAPYLHHVPMAAPETQGGVRYDCFSIEKHPQMPRNHLNGTQHLEKHLKLPRSVTQARYNDTVVHGRYTVLEHILEHRLTLLAAPLAPNEPPLNVDVGVGFRHLIGRMPAAI